MSLLGHTVPLALVAAFFPPGLATVIWLLSLPRGQARALAYFAGAATCTIGSGIVILVLLESAGAVSDRHPALAASARLAVGVMLLIVSGALAARKSIGAARVGGSRDRPQRPRYGWIFVLGLAMWTPSFAYLAALEFIADAQLRLPVEAAHLLIVDAVILLMVELPLLIHSLAPGWATRQLQLVNDRIGRFARPIAVLAAGGGGLFLTVSGLRELV